ncbi:MAG: Gfo/Idh/MocA family oxidoreductase [Woeseia sp.]|nr:Gfo/Idh/MocA family oxidoreductase [Woeseia sp.]
MSKIDKPRRQFLRAAGATTLAGAFGGTLFSMSQTAGAQSVKTIRWGIVGTGGIANSMAGMIKRADASEIGAVSSRRMAAAQAFADRHDVPNSFDSWQAMIDSDVVDAIYVATPTSVREEICVAAANGGKHVLGEKPFASLPSVRRITTACRDNNVAFMDGTHFVHHPRTHDIKHNRDEKLGFGWSVASAFQFNLTDRGNIRFNTELEPMGAIGDAGWYNMRAAVEYLSPDAELDTVSAHLRRDRETGAAISGSGVLDFTDGSTSTWNCGFDSGAVVMDLRITGTGGVINIDDFLGQNRDGSADYLYRKGGWGGGTSDEVNIESDKPGAALMFEDMAAAAADPGLREQWMTATERTQALLDAAWMAALHK